MDVEPGPFRCLKCGSETEIFYSSKTGLKLGWTCLNDSCKARGFFTADLPHQKAVLIEA